MKTLFLVTLVFSMSGCASYYESKQQESYRNQLNKIKESINQIQNHEKTEPQLIAE